MQGGLGYLYSGECAPNIVETLARPFPAFGAQFRYKFDRRLALQTKFEMMPKVYDVTRYNIEVSGEYNFFRFGISEYDIFVHDLSPFISVGVGAAAAFDDVFKFQGIYIPVGVGFKWNFAPRWQLQGAWQHQVYLTKEGDNIDGSGENQTSNIMNNDVLSTLTVGIVFEFAVQKYNCVVCNH